MLLGSKLPTTELITACVIPAKPQLTLNGV